MSFSKVIGHDFQKEFLIKSIEKGRVANSYLFYGQQGIGKRLVALEFAKLLNCRRKNDGLMENQVDGCTCISCMKIDSSNHPDVTLVKCEDSFEIKVKQIREQIEDLIYLKPYEGKYKVSIVDDAEAMNTNAQNAFLKTLEEPPTDAVIILISSKPQYLLKTIISRCQSLEFFRLNDGVIENAIKQKAGLSQEQYDIAVKLSQGSLSKAILLDEQLIAERKEIIEKISELKSHNAVELLEFIDSIASQKLSNGNDNLKIFFETLFMWLKDILYIKSGISDENLVHKDIYNISKKISDRWSFEHILELRSFLEEARDSLFHRNVNKQYVLQNLIIKFVQA
jgi:DNA polymerase-3 subunit delta'